MADLRTIKTKRAIHEAFLEEIKRKDITELRVTDICAKAMINKSTFYKHYVDINDLIDKMQEEFVDKLMDEFIDKDKLFTDTLAFLYGIKNLIGKYENLFTKIFKDQKFAFISKIDNRLTSIYVTKNPPIERRVLINFILSGTFRTIGSVKFDKSLNIDDVYLNLAKIIKELN